MTHLALSVRAIPTRPPRAHSSRWHWFRLHPLRTLFCLCRDAHESHLELCACERYGRMLPPYEDGAHTRSSPRALHALLLGPLHALHLWRGDDDVACPRQLSRAAALLRALCRGSGLHAHERASPLLPLLPVPHPRRML